MAGTHLRAAWEAHAALSIQFGMWSPADLTWREVAEVV